MSNESSTSRPPSIFRPVSELSTVTQPTAWISRWTLPDPQVHMLRSLSTFDGHLRMWPVVTWLCLDVPSQPDSFTIPHAQRDSDSWITNDPLCSGPRVLLRLSVLLHDGDSPAPTKQPQHGPREFDLRKLFAGTHPRAAGPREKRSRRGCDKRLRLPVVRPLVRGRDRDGLLLLVALIGFRVGSGRHPAIRPEGEAV